MREQVIKLKLINKNKQHNGLKMYSVETRTAHSRAGNKKQGIWIENDIKKPKQENTHQFS